MLYAPPPPPLSADYLALKNYYTILQPVRKKGEPKYHDLDLAPPGGSHIPAVCARPHGGCPCWISWCGHLEGHRGPGEGFFCSLRPTGREKVLAIKAVLKQSFWK